MKNRHKKQSKKTWIPNHNQRRAEPVKKKEYEMPDDYKDYLQKLVVMLDDRAEYDKILPTLPPDVRAGAMPIVRKLDKSIEKLEQILADEYDVFQSRQQRIEEAEENKGEAGSRLYEYLQRLFIVAKHKFPPEKFRDFEANWVKDMSPEWKKTFYEHIALRESYDLENILADPDGGIKRKMKHPQLQMKEAIFEIARVAYVTDDFFKESEAEYEKAVAIRDRAEKNLWLYMPKERAEQRRDIEKLDRRLDEGKLKMMEYLEICFDEDGKVEVENPDQEKLDAAFALAGIAQERMYIMYKHTRPKLLEKFTPICLSAYETPEEIEQFYERIKKREEDELDKILASLN